MVEYSAFNRFVPGSSPGQPNARLKGFIITIVKIKKYKYRSHGLFLNHENSLVFNFM